MHTVAVTSKGVLWAWSDNVEGQLGIVGLKEVQIVPALLGAKDVFGGSPVRMVACSKEHTLIVTEEGTLWNPVDVPWRRKQRARSQQHQRSAGADKGGGAVLWRGQGRLCRWRRISFGSLYTWGRGQNAEDASPTGLGHDDMLAKLVHTCVTQHILQGARVGRYHSLPLLHVIAFAMGTHTRLGGAAPTATPAGGGRSWWLEGKAPAAAANTSTDCEYVMMPGELVKRVVEACTSWREGQTGEMQGVVRLLGGMMRDEVSH